MPINVGLESCGKDILSGDDAVGRLSAEPSRNGFRDTGRGGASDGDTGPCRGEAARLRKGLLEERLRLCAVDGRASMTQTGFC